MRAMRVSQNVKAMSYFTSRVKIIHVEGGSQDLQHRRRVKNMWMPTALSRPPMDELTALASRYEGLKASGAGLLEQLYAAPKWELPRHAEKGDHLPTELPTCPRCTLRLMPKRIWMTSEICWGCPDFPRCKGSKPWACAAISVDVNYANEDLDDFCNQAEGEGQDGDATQSFPSQEPRDQDPDG